MKGNKPNQKEDIKERFIYQELIKTKNIYNIVNFNKTMETLEQKSQTEKLSVFQKFIILFYSHYNHLTCQTKKEKKLYELSLFMLSNFRNHNILSLVQDEINENYQDDFKNYKIFSNVKKNDSYETCFSLGILSKNIKIMKSFFYEYLNFPIFDENEFNYLCLDNPHACTLFDSIFNKIYGKIKNNNKDNLYTLVEESIKDTNQSIYNILHCPNCYDIMTVELNDKNNFNTKCSSCDKKAKDLEEKSLLNSVFIQFKCSVCKKNLFLYRQNYRCSSCKCLLCSNCKLEHLRSCFSLYYIKLYEVGYRCDIHNRNYEHYCFSCKKICVKYVKISIGIKLQK